MLFKKLFALFLVCVLAFTATGCRLFNPGGDDDPAVAPPAAKLAVVIAKPAAAVAPSIRAAIRADIARLPLAGATVNIIFADGTSEILTEDPANPGTYLVDLTDALKARLKKGYIIKAVKGEVELLNFVHEDEIGADEDFTKPIATNELTTAYSHAAANQSGTTLDGAGFLNTVVDFKLDDLRNKFNENDATVTDIINFFINVVFAAKEDGEVKSVDTTEIDGKIAGIAVTKKPGEELVKAIAQRYVNATVDFYGQKTITPAQVTALKELLSPGFMNNGLDKEAMATALGAGYTPGDLNESMPTGLAISEMKLVKLDENNYLVGPNGTLSFTGKTEPVIFDNGWEINKELTVYNGNSMSPENNFPFLVTKDGENWLIKGNGIKASEISIHLLLQYLADAASNKTQSALNFEITGNGITGVSVTGEKISGTIDLVTINNRWVHREGNYQFTNGNPVAGDKFEVTINYGSTSQKFNFTVTDLTGTTAPSTGVTVAVNAAKTGLTFAWPASTRSDFNDYEVFMSDGQGHENSKKITNKTTVTTDLDFPQNAEGGAKLYVQFTTFTNRGLASQYICEKQIPASADPTAQAVTDMVRALNTGTYALGQGVATIQPPVLRDQIASIRASTGVEVYAGFGLTGAKFYDSLTVGTDPHTNIFALKSDADAGITNHLMQLLKDDHTTPVTYQQSYPYFSAPIASITYFGMVVYVAKDFSGGNIAMKLETNFPRLLPTAVGEYGIDFISTGKITAGNYEIVFDKAWVDVNNGDEGLKVLGNINAALKTNGEPFKIDGKPATIVGLDYDQNGITNEASNPAEIRVDYTGFNEESPTGTVVATVARNAQGVVQLTIHGDTPAENQVINIE